MLLGDPLRAPADSRDLLGRGGAAHRGLASRQTRPRALAPSPGACSLTPECPPVTGGQLHTPVRAEQCPRLQPVRRDDRRPGNKGGTLPTPWRGERPATLTCRGPRSPGSGRVPEVEPQRRRGGQGRPQGPDSRQFVTKQLEAYGDAAMAQPCVSRGHVGSTAAVWAHPRGRHRRPWPPPWKSPKASLLLGSRAHLHLKEEPEIAPGQRTIPLHLVPTSGAGFGGSQRDISGGHDGEQLEALTGFPGVVWTSECSRRATRDVLLAGLTG